ncbi:MAG: anti-sigma regulatory factor, partial [Ramlibacter sp.]|nr:anti-sigma regulatory factor [Ramlibacter sp.]
MEVIAGALHTVFPMDDSSRVGEARRHAAVMAEQAGLDEGAAGRLAIVVTELGNNLARHAMKGRLLIARSGAAGVEIISMDEGPGMPDVERCMSDGYSTAGTPGTGLGAVKRMADDFELHSAVPDGTILIARVRAGRAASRHPHGVRVAGISLAAPGEYVCGDSWAAGLNGVSG